MTAVLTDYLKPHRIVCLGDEVLLSTRLFAILTMTGINLSLLPAFYNTAIKNLDCIIKHFIRLICFYKLLNIFRFCIICARHY